MNPKTIFALYGSGNVGKSKTIKIVYDLLKQAYPTAPVLEINTGSDIMIVITINGKAIGIESQGDPNTRLPQSLKDFKKAACVIIVCATRNWGGTVDAVKRLEPEYTIVWHHKKRELIVKLQTRRNSIMARIIFNQIKKLL
jgi:hypothetical protein